MIGHQTPAPQLLTDHVVVGRERWEELAALEGRARDKLDQLRSLALDDRSEHYIQVLTWLLGEV